jgi:O-antigen/teichoic acid export membrane protein
MTAVGSQAILFVISMVGTVVLARLVSPDDYGLYGMVAVIIGFARTFRDGGLSFATVQRATITEDQMSALFWVNLAFVGILGLAMALSAPLMVRFYGHQELAAVTLVMAVAFMVNCISTQHDALLKRHMRFDALAVGQILAMAASVAVAIGLAYIGWGYWALVASSCVIAVVSTAYSFAIFPWLPGKLRRGIGLRGMLRFGGDVMGFNFVNYFSRNADNIVVGKFAGADALGFYGKAYNLFLLPLTQIRDPMIGVAMPAMSSLVGDPERYSRYYSKLVDGISTLAVPISMFCLIEADFLVRVLLGPAWTAVVPIFRILAVVGLVQSAEATRGLVMVSRGETRRHFRWGMVNAAVVIPAFMIGVRWGAVGVAVGYVVASYILLIPSLMYAFAGSAITLGSFLRALAPSFLCSLVAAAPTLALRYWIGLDSQWAALASSAVFVVAYFAVSMSRPPFRANLQRVGATIRRKSVVDRGRG